MAKKDLPDIETLRQLLTYDPKTGKLYWNKRTPELCKFAKYPKRSASFFNAKFFGKEAGSLTHEGYISLTLYNNNINAHIICWAIYYGEIPNLTIDHINGIKSDNRIFNLRKATKSQQAKNRKVGCSNTSGVTGVYKHKDKWRVRISCDGKKMHFGLFVNFEDAVKKRKEVELKYYGEFARK